VVAFEPPRHIKAGCLTRRFEAPDEKQHWYGGYHQPPDDAEAIHESYFIVAQATDPGKGKL